MRRDAQAWRKATFDSLLPEEEEEDEDEEKRESELVTQVK